MTGPACHCCKKPMSSLDRKKDPFVCRQCLQLLKAKIGESDEHEMKLQGRTNRRGEDSDIPF